MTLSIQSHLSFLGPNVWSRMPVTLAVIDARGISPNVDVIPPLSTLFAGLANEVHQGIALEPRASMPFATIGEAVAAIALDVQRTAGVPVEFSTGRMRPDSHGFDAVVEHEHALVGLLALRIAVQWLTAHLDPAAAPVDLTQEFARFVAFNESNDHGVMGRAIANAAARRQIPQSVLDPRGRMLELGTGRYRQRVSGQATSKNGAIAAYTASDKHLTASYVRAAGLPVPESRSVRTLPQALVAATAIGYPVVLKPNDLKDNLGVELDLRAETELRAAFARTAETFPGGRGTMVVERMIPGNDYRFLIVNDAVIGVSQRLHPQVIGDGVHTIRQLIAIENANPRRSTRATSVYKPLVVDERVHRHLAHQGCTVDHLPSAGQAIVLQESGHRRDGATHVDVTDRVHPANIELLRTAARVIGLDIAGIDVVTPDIARPIRETGGAIIEINESPAFNLHLFPYAGSPRDPGPAVIDMLFPPGQPVRAKVIAVSESETSSSDCASIADALSHAGFAVGLATHDGVSVAGTAYTGVDGRNPNGARTLLNNPLVEVAVVEIEPASIAAHGLGFGACDVLIIPSLSGLLRPNGEPVETVLLDTLDPSGLLIRASDMPQLPEIRVQPMVPGASLSAETIAKIVQIASRAR